jgi:Fic family protein
VQDKSSSRFNLRLFGNIRQDLVTLGNMRIPPKYSITPTIIEFLGKIEANRQYLKSLNISHVLNEKIQRVSLLKSSLFSAKIEGNPLSLDDYKQSSDKVKKLEILNILEAINYISKQRIKSINISLIRMIHKLTMKDVHFQSGRFRTEMSAIFNQAGIAVYICPPPEKIVQLINQLTDYINSEKEKFSLIKAFIAHLLFEKIHPFLDGNGRVGRLMIYLICKKDNYQFYPNISFEEYLNENKTDYYYYLDVGLKNIDDYLLFMLKAFYFQTEKLKKEIEKEIGKKTEFNLPPRQEEIMQIIRDHRLVSLDFIKRRFLKVPARTLRYDLKKLCNKGLIMKIGQTKGVYYKVIKI